VVVFVVQEFPFWPVTWKRRTGLVLEQMGMLSGAKAKVENRRKNEAFTGKEWAVCKRFYSADDYRPSGVSASDRPSPLLRTE
jgi:hypothetical protein